MTLRIKLAELEKVMADLAAPRRNGALDLLAYYAALTSNPSLYSKIIRSVTGTPRSAMHDRASHRSWRAAFGLETEIFLRGMLSLVVHKIGALDMTLAAARRYRRI